MRPNIPDAVPDLAAASQRRAPGLLERLQSSRNLLGLLFMVPAGALLAEPATTVSHAASAACHR